LKKICRCPIVAVNNLSYAILDIAAAPQGDDQISDEHNRDTLTVQQSAGDTSENNELAPENRIAQDVYLDSEPMDTLLTIATVETEIASTILHDDEAHQIALLPIAELTCASPSSTGTSSSLDANMFLYDAFLPRTRQGSFSRDTRLFEMISKGPVDIPAVLELIGIPHDTPLVPQKNRMAGLKMDVNNITDHNDQSLLHMACASGNLDLVKVLLYLAGSYVNQTDARGWTPLHCAAAGSHMEIVKVLAQCQGTQVETRCVSKSLGVDINCDEEEQPGWVYPPDGPIDIFAVTPYETYGDGMQLEASDVAPNSNDSMMITDILKGTFCIHS
jgi:hypothetical protein